LHSNVKQVCRKDTALCHPRPRVVGQAPRLWPRELAAAVRCEQGLTGQRVSAETIRAARAPRGVRWKRAPHWLTSPAPADLRKKTVGPA